MRRDFDGLAGGGGGGGLSSAGAGRLPAADHHRTDSSGSVPINVLHERSGPKQKVNKVYVCACVCVCVCVCACVCECLW